MSNTNEPSFEFIYAGVNPSSIIKVLSTAEKQRLPLMINNALVCEFLSSSGNIIKNYLEETRSIDLLTETELVSSPAERSLLDILKEENPLNLSDEQLLLNHVIAEAVERQGRIEEVYQWLQTQFQIDTKLIPLFDRAINLRVIKDKNAANLRFYQLTGKLNEKLTVEEAKEKREPGILYLSGEKQLESLKTHPEAVKYLKTSTPLVLLITDWITLSVLLNINDFKKRLSKAEGTIVYLLAIPELDEKETERYNEIISAIIGPNKTIKDALKLASENGDYIIMQKDYSKLLTDTEYGCPIIYDDIINNPESVIEYLNRTAKLNLTLGTDEAEKNKEEDETEEEKTQKKEEVEKRSSNDKKEETEKAEKKQIVSKKKDEKPDVDDNNLNGKKQVDSEDEENVNISPSKHLLPKPTEAALKPPDSIYEVGKEKKTKKQFEKEIVIANGSTETSKEKKELKEEKEEVITVEKGDAVETTTPVKAPVEIRDARKELDDLLSEAIKTEFPDLYDLLLAIYLMPSIPEELFHKSKEEIILLLGEDEGIASLAAQNLINSMLSIDDQIVRIYMARAYAIIASHRPAVCRQVVTQNTIRIGLSGNREERRRLVEILASMARQHLETVVYVMEAFISHFVNSDSPLEFERGKSFVNAVTGAEQRLALPVIDTYLSYFDSLPEEKLPDLSTTISSFDGATVGIELVTDFTLKRAKIIAKEIAKHLENTSFIALVMKILEAWENGDVHKISQLSGSILPSKTLEKYERLSIAKKIRKIGNIPIDSLSKSLNKKQDELEALIVDLIVKDELDAKLEMVGDRMFVIMNEEKEKKTNSDEEKGSGKDTEKLGNNDENKLGRNSNYENTGKTSSKTSKRKKNQQEEQVSKEEDE